MCLAFVLQEGSVLNLDFGIIFACTQFRTILNSLNSTCTLSLFSFDKPAPALVDLGEEEEPDYEDRAPQPPRRRPALRRRPASLPRRRRPSPPPVRPVAAPAPVPVRPLPVRPILRLANGHPLDETDATDVSVWLLAVGLPGLLLLAALAAAALLWRVMRRRQRRARRWVTLLGSFARVVA